MGGYGGTLLGECAVGGLQIGRYLDPLKGLLRRCLPVTPINCFKVFFQKLQLHAVYSLVVVSHRFVFSPKLCKMMQFGHMVRVFD